MTKLLSLIAMCLVLYTMTITATPGKLLRVDTDRLISIIGIVNNGILNDASTLDFMTRENKQDVYIFINSPGGGVATGFQFINAMRMAKARGVRLICAVSSMAASMAFSILVECDERYALKYSLLLWHPMKISGSFKAFSADEMEYVIGVMRSWELPMNQKAIEVLGISRELFYYHYSHETLFITPQLQAISSDFIIQVDDIEGVGEMFNRR